MAIIQSSADIIKLLQKQYGDDVRTRKDQHLNHITEQVHRLSLLLDDILLLGKVEEGKIKYAPVLDYIDTYVREIIDAHKPIFEPIAIDITYTVTGKPKKIHFDKKHMQQIVGNLLSNATKYLPGAKAPELTIHYGAHDLELRVKDYGIGIPDDDKPKLFQKFTRAKNVGNIHGYGIGLALVKNLVEMQGGNISFNSVLGKGTTFIINIPYKTTK